MKKKWKKIRCFFLSWCLHILEKTTRVILSLDHMRSSAIKYRQLEVLDLNSRQEPTNLTSHSRPMKSMSHSRWLKIGSYETWTRVTIRLTSMNECSEAGEPQLPSHVSHLPAKKSSHCSTATIAGYDENSSGVSLLLLVLMGMHLKRQENFYVRKWFKEVT